MNRSWRLAPVLFALILGFAAVIVPVPAAAMSPSEFIAMTKAWAQEEERTQGVPASVAMAQSILESGWGESELAKNANAWFGIKCSSTPSKYQNGCYTITTTEYDQNGNPYTVRADFRKYDTPEKSFLDHGEFLKTRTWYANAFNYTNNPDRFIVEVHKGGYATDPQYANKIIDLMQRYNLYQYNTTPPDTGRAELAIRPQTRAAVGATAQVTGLLSPGGGGRKVWTQAMTPSGWSTSQSVTAGPRGQFSIPLTYGKDNPGKQRYRVQAAGPQGTLTSYEFTLERVVTVTVTAYSAGIKALGETTYTWGTATNAPNAKVWSEVLVGGSWSRSQVSTTNSSGNFTIPLTYGANTVGTYTWRVGVDSPQGTVYSSRFTLERAKKPTVSAASAAAKYVGQDTYAWGSATDAPNTEVWTEVIVNGRWSRSQTGSTDSSGRFVLPLTYHSHTVGEQTWRVGLRNRLGTFYSNRFTLDRIPSPVNVSAYSAGTKRVGETTYAWGTASGAPNSRVWTEVYLSTGWSRSQIGTSDSRGWYTLPLTYGINEAGTYRWRVGVDSSQGVFYSEPFTLRRVY